MPCDHLDLEDLDVDMEELESRLYSQIYHSSETPNDASLVFTDSTPRENVSKEITRKSVDVEVTAESLDATSNASSDRNDSFQRDQPEFISIESNVSRKRKSNFISPAAVLRKRENKRLKRLRKKERKKERIKILETVLSVRPPPVVIDEIVEISDDEVYEVPLTETKDESSPKRFKSDETVGEVSRDDFSDDDDEEDDVILIEVPRVVITIDDDKEDLESLVSTKPTIAPKVKISKVASCTDFEEAELLSIPESNSNDFLENVNLNRPDVLDNEMDLTMSSAHENVSYICDYDSQSSTNSSASTSPTKTNFLFNTPQRELTLNDFANYMSAKSPFSLTAGGETTPTGAPKSGKSPLSINDFETSSESEYDYVVKKIQNGDSETQETALHPGGGSDVQVTPVQDTTTAWGDFTEEEEEDLDEDVSIVELLNVTNRKKKQNKKIARKSLNFSDFWTEDMNKFYRESWGQEDYDVDEVKKNMPDDPGKWKIIRADQGGIFKTPQGRRCFLCREFGHRSFRCPKKLSQPCILCASLSHLESNCPHSLCTTCGRPNNGQTNWCRRCNLLREVSCKICSFRGHEDNRCPDLWRRYLFTTAEGPIQKNVDTTTKPSSEMWCSGCASSGHYQFDCRKRFNPYSSTSTLIHEYKEVYNNLPGPQNTKTDKPKDSSLCDKENSTVNSSINYLKLTVKESEKLTSREGYGFLSQMNRTTGLKFKVMTQNFKHRTRKYFCIIEGHQSKITAAKFAVKNYCGGKSLGEVIHRKLIELDGPHKRWYNYGKALYRSIEKADNSAQKNLKILKQCKLGAKYSALNTILIGKLMILDGRKHMENLRKFDADRTGKLLSNDVRASYDYVFNRGERLKVDYPRLINDLPRFSYQHRKIMVKGTYKSCLMYCTKRKMFTKLNNLNKLWKNVLDSKYSEDVMEKFCQFCSTNITISPKKKIIN